MSIQQASKCYVRWEISILRRQDMSCLLTEYEREHVWQCTRCIIDYMELACLEQRKPDTSALAEDFSNAPSECYQSCGIQ